MCRYMYHTVQYKVPVLLHKHDLPAPLADDVNRTKLANKKIRDNMITSALVEAGQWCTCNYLIR
jgi:hypothetical protein